MSTSITNILQGFHNLKEITIGNRKKELFLLIRSYGGQLQTSEIDYLVEQLKPTTYLEQKLFVDILIYFKCEKELLKIFCEGNEKLIKQLWKESWFFEKLFQNTVEFIVDQIFPQLSYVTRIRLLKNVIYYINEEQKADELYEMILSKYGATNAQYVLATCSSEKILHTISNGQVVNFSNKQLIFLHKYKKTHFSKLLSTNVDNHMKILDFYDRHSKAFHVIAGSDFEVFLTVFIAQNCSSIGKRLTKKMLTKNLPYLLEEASEIYQRFHQRTLAKGLGSNLEKFVFSTWPSSFSMFRPYNCLALMKYCPRTKYLEILKRGLNEVYNTSLSEHPELISDDLLDITDNIEVRESLLEIRLRDSKEDYTLPKYYSIDKSIPILKKKISFADGVRTRENLIVALVKTCKINNDLDALLKVQEYFNFRHKNDDESIRSSFLNELKSCFDLSLLTEAHWNLIIDFMKWSKVKKQYFWGTGEIYMLHIKFMFKNNGEMTVISQFFEKYLADILKSFKTSWILLDDVPKLQEFLMKKLLQILTSFGDEENRNDLYLILFEIILEWNKKNPNKTVNFLLYPEIRESIKNKLKGRCPSYSRDAQYLGHFIKGKIQCEDETFLVELEQLFWDYISDKFDVNIIEHFLRKFPMKIVEHFDKFISAMKDQYLSDSVTIWRLLSHYDHISLVQKVTNYLMSTKDLFLRGVLGIALATLLTGEEYSKLIAKHKNEMLDIDDEEQVRNHHKAIELLPNAKYNDSFLNLPSIVLFCEGDTLHDALPALYYYFQHTPEKYLLEHLLTLSKRAVSVRKHSVKLACSVSPIDVVYNLIQNMIEGEKNMSVLEHIYWKTFKYFRVNNSEKFWVLLQHLIKSLDLLESNAFKETCDMNSIPKNYRLPYLDFVWKLLDEREQQGQNILNLKEAIINSITSEMFRELPYEFCSKFIKQEFLKFSDSSRTVRSFTIKCLKYCTQKELLVRDVCDVILEFKKNYILNPDFKISCKAHSYLDSFTSDIFYEQSNLEISVIEAFFAKWLAIFTPIEDINIFIRFTMVKEFRKVENLDDYILKIAELQQMLFDEFGVVGVFDCFNEALCQLLPNKIFDSSKHDEKLYKLALKLAEMENNNLKLLAISLLPEGNPESNSCVEMQRKFIDILRKSEERSVLVNFNLYLKTLG